MSVRFGFSDLGYIVPRAPFGVSGLRWVHHDPEDDMCCDGLTINCDANADSVVLQLRGELDACNTPHVAATLAHMIDHSTGNVEIDVSGLEFVDLAGVRLLLELSRGVDAVHRRLSLVHPSPIFTRIIGLLGAGETDAVDGPPCRGARRPANRSIASDPRSTEDVSPLNGLGRPTSRLVAAS